jgi:hypothetical protein
VTRSLGSSGRRALVGLLSATMLLALLPGTVQASTWQNTTGAADGSNWSWPGMAQTIVASPGVLTDVTLTLHRASTDTGTYRVEVRALSGDAPSGHQVASTGVVLAARNLNATNLSTDENAPTAVNVVFVHPAVVTAEQRVAVVLLRGTNNGISWHASNPALANPYPDGRGWFCVIGSCWSGSSPQGQVDFLLSIGGTSPLFGSINASVVAPSGPTRASTFNYTIAFDKPVSGLTAGDFTKTGTATGCSIKAPSSTDGGQTWTLPVGGCSAGTFALTLKANTVHGPEADPGTGPSSATPGPAVLRIDRTKPKVGTPRATPSSGPLDGNRIPIKLTWAQGTDAGGAGVWKYQVGQSTDGGATWTLLGESQPQLAVTTAKPSGTTIYRIRAVDWAGNRGAWMKGPTLSPRLVQQTSASITYSSGWTTINDAAFSGGSARQSDASNASARYTFSGRAIGIVMSTDPSLGIVKVYVDGTLSRTIDMATLTPGDRMVVYGRSFTSLGTHTIRILSSSGARPNVVLDAFVRL